MLATSPADESVDDNGTLCAELLDDLWLIRKQQARLGRGGVKEKKRKREKKKEKGGFFSSLSSQLQVGASPEIDGKHFSF